jgi:hypothetical protein
MAAIPCTFQGVLFFSDLGIGGGPMPGGPQPSHPIAPGGPPPGYWGGVAPPHPDQGLPGQPPGYWGGVAPPLPTHPIAPGGQPPTIWPSPGHPAHPIAPGGPPLGIWGGVAPPYPDQGLPGSQPHPSHPIVIPPGALAPGIPSHPIYWPIHPDQGLPGAQPHPEHPIVIPGDDEAKPKFEVKTAWTPTTGWIVVVVPGEDTTVPTPSG